MTIKDLIQKYSLTKEDTWELARDGRKIWIITHDACEKIAAMEKIELVSIQVLNSERTFARFLVTMKKDNKQITSIGEAELITGEKLEKKTRSGNFILKGNCESQFVGCMAEKRGIDRCVLKLIDAYQYGVYSDAESDEFKKNSIPQETNEIDFREEARKILVNYDFTGFDDEIIRIEFALSQEKEKWNQQRVDSIVKWLIDKKIPLKIDVQNLEKKVDDIFDKFGGIE